MKKSELQKIIKEEVDKKLNESRKLKIGNDGYGSKDTEVYMDQGDLIIRHHRGGGIDTIVIEKNEVVVHPFALGMKNYFTKTQNVDKEKVSTGVKGKRGRPKKDPSELKTLPVYKPTGGKRGRKALDPEVKAAREAERLERAKNSNGKRGRPKKA